MRIFQILILFRYQYNSGINIISSDRSSLLYDVLLKWITSTHFVGFSLKILILSMIISVTSLGHLGDNFYFIYFFDFFDFFYSFFLFLLLLLLLCSLKIILGFLFFEAYFWSVCTIFLIIAPPFKRQLRLLSLFVGFLMLNKLSWGLEHISQMFQV